MEIWLCPDVIKSCKSHPVLLGSYLPSCIDAVAQKNVPTIPIMQCSANVALTRQTEIKRTPGLTSFKLLHFVTLAISSDLLTFYQSLMLVFLTDAARLPPRLRKASRSSAAWLCTTVNRCVRSAGPFVTSCDSAVNLWRAEQ